MRDLHRHRTPGQRPLDHWVAGGHHRQKKNGCMTAAVAIVGAGAGLLVAALYGATALVQAFI